MPKLSRYPRWEAGSSRPAVDPAQVFAVHPDLPLEEQLLLLGPQAVLLQPGQGGQAGEHRGDQGGLCPGADQLPAGALPQNGADGVNYDGLARARLAGEHIETAAEFNVHRLDDGNIFDMKQ